MRWSLFLLLLLVIGCEDKPYYRGTIQSGQATTPTNPGTQIPTPTNTIATNALHSACQSAYRCLYTYMPTYSQSDPWLESYIGRQVGVSNYSDPGLCAPTTTAMLLKGVLSERHRLTRLNNSFLESFPEIYWHEIVYKIGLDANTDFINGGTYGGNIFYVLQNEYFNQTVAAMSLYLNSENWMTTNQDVIDLIKRRKPALYVEINGYQKIGNTYQQQDRGHAMMIKGFVGDRLHMQDPWGMDHFARLNTEGSFRVFTDFGVSSAYYMGRYGGNHKIVLENVFGLRLD